MLISNEWDNYELLDVSNKEKLERWNDCYIVRPFPAAKFLSNEPHEAWNHVDIKYAEIDPGASGWFYSDTVTPAPQPVIQYKDFTFQYFYGAIGHMGIKPEHAVLWDWCFNTIQNLKKDSETEINVLNLFAGSGCTSVACAKAGASVVHVDESLTSNECARENAALSDVSGIRFVSEFPRSYVKRELRRETRYQAVIADCPAFGRAERGSFWSFSDIMQEFVMDFTGLLTSDPAFVLLTSPNARDMDMCAYLLEQELVSRFGGRVELDALALPVTQSGAKIPVSYVCRYYRQ